MDPHKLQVILKKHKAWLRNNKDGEKANLGYANLGSAKNISELQKIRTQICPQSGSFTAFKKLNGGIVAKLQIPASAKRSNAPGGRKCRASTARVISFIDSEETEAYSQYARDFIYRVGETVTPEKKFCENFSEECTSGIHFYLSKEEAEAP